MCAAAAAAAVRWSRGVSSTGELEVSERQRGKGERVSDTEKIMRVYAELGE